MSIVAAKCPVCGRDIGFEETAKEYTCIFCGAKLLTSALKSERPDKRVVTETVRPTDELFDRRRPVPRAEAERPRPEEKKEPEPKPEEKKEPELTEEEIKHELERKVGFKEELREVAKQIDDLRGKREPLKKKLKTAKTMTTVGVAALAVIVIALFVLLDTAAFDTTVLLVAGSLLAVVAIFMIVFSIIRKKETEKEQKRLENNISEKKQKRDVLIGRLNKINKKLHIHSGD